MQIFKHIVLVVILINLGFVLFRLIASRKMEEDEAKKGLRQKIKADAEKKPQKVGLLPYNTTFPRYRPMAEKNYREDDAKEKSPSDGKENFSDFDASHLSESDKEFLGHFQMKW